MTQPEAFITSDNRFRQALEEVGETQWLDLTPDNDWTVRDLVAHNLEGLVWVPHVLSGKTIEEAVDAYAGDLLGDDPGAAWDEASSAARQALEGLDLNMIVHLSYGDVTARTYLQHQLIDFTIHSWDLARAVGADETVDPELAAAAYDWFKPEAESWRDAGLLKPAVSVSVAADVWTRLLALSGRQSVTPG